MAVLLGQGTGLQTHHTSQPWALARGLFDAVEPENCARNAERPVLCGPVAISLG